jgi:hypothetical protein
MPSQKSPKPPKDMTTDEAIKSLFPREVIKHAKDRVAEPDRVLPQNKRLKKSMSED